MSVVVLSAAAETNWTATLPDPRGNNDYEPDDPIIESRVVGGSGATELQITASLLQTKYQEPSGGYFESVIMPMIGIDTLGTIGYNVQYGFSGGAIGAPNKLFQPDLSNNKGTTIQFPAPAVGQDPFYFPYYGYSYSSFFLSENGFITFGQSSNNPAAPPQSTFPSAANAPNCVIAALWADLATTQGQVWAGFSSDPWWTDTFSIIWQGVSGGVSFMLSLREDGAIIIQYWNIGGFAGSSAGYENLDATKGARLSSTQVVSNNRIIIYPTPGSYQYIDHVDLSVNKLSGGSNDALSGIYFVDPGGKWAFPGMNVYTPDQYVPPYGSIPEDVDENMKTILGAAFTGLAFIPVYGEVIFGIAGIMLTVSEIVHMFMPEWEPLMSTYSNSSYGTSGPAAATIYANDWGAKPVYNRVVPQTFYIFPVIDWRTWDIGRTAPHSLTIDLSAYVIDGGNYNPLNPDANYQHNAYTLATSQVVFGFNKDDAQVRVTSPNGGESWVAGTTHAITWDAGTGNTPLSSLGPKVNIDLFQGATSTRIAAGVPNTGSYSWTLPTSIAAGTNYIINVSSKWMRETIIDQYGVTVDKGPVSDTSNAVFTITNPYVYVRVTSPNGGEFKWATAGSRLYVYYAYSGIGDYDDLSFYLYKGDIQAYYLGYTWAIGGYYWWTMPDTIASGTDYRVKIVQTANPSVYDYSDGYFTISNPRDAWLAITSPNGGEYWLPGETHFIRWNSGNILTGGVNLLLYSGGSPSDVIAYNAPNTGSYVWTIPDTGYSHVGGPQCLIYIEAQSSYYYGVKDYSDAYFELDDSWIDVYYPGQDDTYVNPGGPCYIMWQNNNYPGDNYVNIVLYKGGVLDSTIALSAPNNGFYQWTVPSGQQIGTDYTIGVSSTTKAASDITKVFTITSFVVTSPNGGETFPGGTLIPVTWTCAYPPPGETALIELFKGSTRVGYGSTENDGDAVWGVPTTPGSDYRIQVSVSGTGVWLSDISDAYFTVSEPATLSLISPNGGESWRAGEVHMITWSTSGFLSDSGVNIFLIGNGQSIEIVHATANSGAYSWAIPLSLPIASDYEIMLCGAELAYSQIWEFSDGTFTIATAPTITVTSPNGGETWGAYTDVPHTITWASSDIQSGGVNIFLYKGGVLYSQITQGTANDGSFDWRIPTGQPYGTDYKIRVQGTDTLYQWIYDDSDGFFTIDAAPTTPGIPTIAPGDELDGTFTLTWAASSDTDPTPVAGYYLIETLNNGAWTVVNDNILGTSITLTRSPGSYVYAVCAFDTADPPDWSYWAITDFFNPIVVPVLDSVPPVTTATLAGISGSNGWYKSAVDVTLSASDSNGVKTTYYKIDSARKYSTYTGPFQIATDGKHTVYFYSVDNKGYTEAVKSVSVWVDKTAPTTTASTKGTTAVTVTLKATDSASGVASTFYSLDYGTTWLKYTVAFKISGKGLHTVYFYSVDNAGNQEALKSTSFTIR